MSDDAAAERPFGIPERPGSAISEGRRWGSAMEPPSISAQERLIAAALALDYNFDIRRILEDAVLAREFVQACRDMRDAVPVDQYETFIKSHWQLGDD